MAVGLSGNLEDFGIADVFQLIGQQRKTGKLELRNDRARVELVFDGGMVVSAQPSVGRASDPDPLADRLVRCGQLTRERADEAIALCRASAQTLARTLVDRTWLDARSVEEASELITRDTIFEVLRWQRGSFDFRAEEVSHERSPGDLLGAEQILMDGLRMVDEWQSFQALVPSEDAVFARADRLDGFLEGQSRMGPEDRGRAERVYGLIDGRLSVRRVIDLARLGTFDGVRCFAELHQAGVIQAALAGEPTARGSRLLASVGEGGWTARRAAAHLAPLLALVGIVWWTAASSATATVERTARIERSTLASLQQDYAMRAIRQALEAYRLGHGAWPDRLEDLERVGLLTQGTLAALETPPYYAKDREPGPVLLAPERP